MSDITVSSDDLNSLVTLKEISNLLMARIRSNYRSIMSFNTALIVLRVVGIIPPTTSAFLHNASTLAFTLKSMTKLI